MIDHMKAFVILSARRISKSATGRLAYTVVGGASAGIQKDPGFFAALRMTQAAPRMTERERRRPLYFWAETCG